MLVLTRKVGDVIAIGDNIKIVVMAIKGKQVRLGVQADRSTVVHREEIYQKIQQEIRAALQTDVPSTTAAGDLLRSATDVPREEGLAGAGRVQRGVSPSLVRKPAETVLPEADSEDKSSASKVGSSRSSRSKPPKE